jgi:hypothetical protein
MTDDFRPPNEVAEADDRLEKSNTQEQPSKVDSLVDNDIGGITMGSARDNIKKKIADPKNHFWSRGLKLRPASQNHKIIGSSIAAAILIIGGGAIFALKNSFNNYAVDEPSTFRHEPKTSEPSVLTGVQVPIGTNKQRVIGVMIENSPDARPQAGLYESGMVFEAIAEGGITRFLTLHLEKNPSYIGPVRSVRPYYADWAASFDAALAHAGGSHEGIVRMEKLKIPDLDYTVAGGAFQRVSDRFAPHNLYTNMKALKSEAKRLKHQKQSRFTPLDRKIKENAKPPAAKVKNINFSISGGLYDARFVYDAKSNSYKRFMGGSPHRDHKSGKQISPKVVVALVTKYNQSGIYSVYKTAGSGQIVVFQDGQAYKGTWKRKDGRGSLQFFDTKGQPLELNPGQTWVTALKSAGQAKYGP